MLLAKGTLQSVHIRLEYSRKQLRSWLQARPSSWEEISNFNSVESLRIRPQKSNGTYSELSLSEKQIFEDAYDDDEEEEVALSLCTKIRQHVKLFLV